MDCLGEDIESGIEDVDECDGCDDKREELAERSHLFRRVSMPPAWYLRGLTIRLVMLTVCNEKLIWNAQRMQAQRRNYLEMPKSRVP